MGSQVEHGTRRAHSIATRIGTSLIAATVIFVLPATAQAHSRYRHHARSHHLQCVPYAREVSGIAIHGNARTWWDQADGVYARGDEPRVGAVLAFKGTRAMPYGHVATVKMVIDGRHVLLDHANWSGPGRIEHGALAVDVSDAGDWSEVRVWYAPSDALGSRTNPTYGFIYDHAPEAPDASETPATLDSGPAHMAGDGLADDANGIPGKVGPVMLAAR